MIIHFALRSCLKELTWKCIGRLLLLLLLFIFNDHSRLSALLPEETDMEIHRPLFIIVFFFNDHSRRSSLLPEETDMEMLGKDQTRAPKRKPPKYIGRYLTCLIFIQYSYFYLFINK